MVKSFKIFLMICIALTSSKAQKLLSKDYVNEVISIQTSADYAIAGAELPVSILVRDINDNQWSTLSKVAYIQLVDDQNREVHRSTIQLNNGAGHGQLFLHDTLKTGIYQINAYTSWMRNFGSSTFGRHQIVIINTIEKPAEIPSKSHSKTPQNSVQISLESEKLSTRQQSFLNISSTSDARFSCSIFRIDSLIKPSTYSPKMPVFGESFSLQYLPEYEGKRITGQLINLSNRKPLPYSNVYISLPQKPVRFFSTKTDSLGHFAIEIPDYTGNHELFFSSLEQNAAVELADPFEKHLQFEQSPDYQKTSKTDSSLLALYHLSTTLQKEFPSNLTTNTPADSTPFYTQASIRYNLDNYVRFPTLEDVFREFVSEVYVRKDDGKTTIQVKELTTDIPFPGKPLVLFDGVPVSDFEELLKYNPKELQFLDIHREPYYHHQEVYNGLIAIYSKPGLLPEFRLDQAVSIIDVPGTSMNREPEAEKLKEEHFPDFRTRLLWEPQVEIKINKQLRIPFITSEIEGTFMVEIKGIDSTMKPVYHSVQFVVKQ